MKIVFQTSFDNDFQVKYKARIVLCGYSQIYGINYLATYAPTIGRDTLRAVFMYGLKHRMKRKVYDVKGAFIEGTNDFRILARIPKELTGGEEYIVEWIRSLYGEKQAAYIWYQRLKEILGDKLGFVVSLNDEALFYLRNNQGGIIMILCVHVDDLFVMAYYDEIFDGVEKATEKHVRELKEFKDVQKYLGMEFTQNDHTLYLHQRNYINNLLDNLDPEIKKSVKSRVYPLSPSIDLSIEQEDIEETYNLLPLVGRLRYLTDCTRPDLLWTRSV